MELFFYKNWHIRFFLQNSKQQNKFWNLKINFCEVKKIIDLLHDSSSKRNKLLRISIVVCLCCCILLLLLLLFVDAFVVDSCCCCCLLLLLFNIICWYQCWGMSHMKVDMVLTARSISRVQVKVLNCSRLNPCSHWFQS